MNKRLKELADQCTSYNDSDGWIFDKAKFAELIIKDCTDIVNKRKDAAIDASWNVDEAMSNAVWDIEAHFYGDNND